MITSSNPDPKAKAQTLRRMREATGCRAHNSHRSRMPWDFLPVSVPELLTPREREIGQAIVWAVRSGRLVSDADTKIRSLTSYQFCALVVEVMGQCATANDVPRWLNGDGFLILMSLAS